MQQENDETIEFVRISHIAYDREKDASNINLLDFQQLLSAMASKSGKFVYMLESDTSGISLYFGTSKNPNDTENTNAEFLRQTFCGIYGGSECNPCKESPLTKELKYSKAMLGLPALKRDSDKSYKQSLEKILFPMQGKRFRILIVAESYPLPILQEIIANLQELGNEVHKIAKVSLNYSQNRSLALSETTSESYTQGESTSYSESKGTSEQSTKSKIASGIATAATIGASVFVTAVTGGAAAPLLRGAIGASANIASMAFNKQESQSTSTSTTTNTSKSTSTSRGTTDTQGDSKGINYEQINKGAEGSEKMIDKYIERFQKGLSYGMWNTALYIQADDEPTLSQLQHTLKSVYGGDESFFEPLRFTPTTQIPISKVPMFYLKDNLHPIHPSFYGLSTAISTEELSILAALPHNDIQGISVSRTANFGLTQALTKENESYIEIGEVLNKRLPTSQRFRLSTRALNSHLFVSGITGSGKSNTIKLLLTKLHNELKLPFLVIEPAKSEYKHLIKEIPDLQVFKPGSLGDCFRFNPFVFHFTRENPITTLTKHTDMLKVAFTSAFPMYGIMPIILEKAIHTVYEDKGWSFETEDNPAYVESKSANYDNKTLLFPTMEDLRDKIDAVVESSGYAQEFDQNIKAALKTRIENLTLGAKGRIFNSRHCLDSNILFEKPTIIELSSIADDEEKAFLMGLLLNRLYQYKEEQGDAQGELKHICVIEEAHRLLPNISSQKGEEANAKGKAVETFTNLLAEIRSYGQGLIIADQIASKLHPDVVKNTNIKILQRTMDKEDREIVGNAINLTQNQILDIAELKTGEAIVHNKDIHQAFMVQIDAIESQKAEEEEFADFRARFYANHPKYKHEFIGEWEFCNTENTESQESGRQSKDYLNQINNIPKLQAKLALLEVLNAAILNQEEQTIQEKWENFIKLLRTYKAEHSNPVIFHLFLRGWKQFKHLSKTSNYRLIEDYKNAYKASLDLIKALENKEGITKAKQELQECFYNENLKPNSTDSKQEDEAINYTLFILENIEAKGLWEKVNQTIQQSPNLGSGLDEALRIIFEKIQTNQSLRDSLKIIYNNQRSKNVF
ncbi:ATP-binding protein [Helicobacter rodentium]|uniref:ATP-binding protein n=1 Tax=Helicobacter rodentium TaxID=59617 RepID=UPI00047BC39B|nr:ATP-binding protein [Helicobacter rodentium]